MLPMLLRQVVPASVYRGQTGYSLLSKLDRQLHVCLSIEEAIDTLDNFKIDLYRALAARFPITVAQALTVKTLNICLAKYHYKARNASLLSRPFGIVVDPSNVCQLACPGCVHSERSEALKLFDWPKGTLTQNCFSQLLGLYGSHAIAVYFCDYGEPLLNLNTPKFIRMAKQYLLGTALSTSFSVAKFDADAYVQSGLDFMVVSIDGATQPVYQQFRRNGNLELVFGNLRKLAEAKRRLGRKTPVVSWNFLAFQHNAHEIPQAQRQARQLGVDQFRVVSPFGVEWDDPAIRPASVKTGVRRFNWFTTTNLPQNWNPFPETLENEAIERSFENPWDRRLIRDEAPTKGHTCQWLYKNIVMDATGRIMPCCGAPRPDTNLVFTTIAAGGLDAYNSQKHLDARRWFSAPGTVSDSSPYCVKCEWDHDVVNIGSSEIRRYFRAADAAFFDRRSLRLLSDW